MDLINELSCEVALAVFVEARLRQKFDVRDAKSFIELIEAELTEISGVSTSREEIPSFTAQVSH